jgi:hypothetical protein
MEQGSRMQVNPTDTKQIQAYPDLGPGRQNNAKSVAAEQTDSVALDGRSAALVQQALTLPDDSETAVAQAKLSLESGQLDTPEAARQAAQAILKFGI